MFIKNAFSNIFSQTSQSDKNTLSIFQSLSTHKNLVFSPLSISLALSMSALGSQGLTRSAFLKYFELNSHEKIAEFASQLMAGLKSNHKGVTTIVANKVYHNIPQLGEQYQQLMQANFKSTIEQINFVENSEAARVKINGQVKALTQDKITDIIPAGGIDASTRAVLVNALYFNGKWLHSFNKMVTTFDHFNLAYNNTGKQVKVPMMQITKELPYLEGKDFKYIQLPYQGNEYIMEIILPEDIQQFEKNFQMSHFTNSRKKQQEQKIKLTLPKFKIGEGEATNLRELLQSVGLAHCFSNEADFGFMDPSSQMKIENVFHKAIIEVTEEGTEAAAATAVSMTLSMVKNKTPVVECNKPFFYAVTHIPTQSFLFLGKLTDPSQN